MDGTLFFQLEAEHTRTRCAHARTRGGHPCSPWRPAAAAAPTGS